MNNRIQQLADHAKAYANQCTKDIDGDVSWHWMEYYTEKFAELIVGECKDLLFESSENNRLPIAVDDMVHIIDTHFGVEE